MASMAAVAGVSSSLKATNALTASNYGRIDKRSAKEQFIFIQEKCKQLEKHCNLLSQLKAIQERCLSQLEQLTVQYPQPTNCKQTRQEEVHAMFWEAHIRCILPKEGKVEER